MPVKLNVMRCGASGGTVTGAGDLVPATTEPIEAFVDPGASTASARPTRCVRLSRVPVPWAACGLFGVFVVIDQGMRMAGGGKKDHH